jgi:hypothetical protein
MSAVIIDIADAVTTVLNAATLSQSFTAERSYLPLPDLVDLDTLQVFVVPESLTSNLLDRTPKSINDYVINIGIQKRLEPSNAACDPYMQLMEEIGDLFLGKTVTYRTATTARCITAENRPIFVQKMLDERHTFGSVVALTFRLGR